MPVALVYDPFFLRHRTPPTEPECPARLEVIMDALESAGLVPNLRRLPFAPASLEDLALVHEPAYIDLVRLACEGGMTFIGDRSTHISAESYEVARLAAGGVLAACDAVMAGKEGQGGTAGQAGITRAFCAIRPPGHHAERDQAMGYCLFNNVAIASEHLVRRHRLSRIAIVDWDVHHGNGSQHLFEHRDDVFYISLHEAPEHLYPGTGTAAERGTGKGLGYTLNIPMPPGAEDHAYRRAFDQQVLPALHRYRPQFLLISAGFDAVRPDRLGDINLDPESYAWMTRELVAIATRYANGRLVSILEGGYALPVLGRCVVHHVRELLPSGVCPEYGTEVPTTRDTKGAKEHAEAKEAGA